MKIFRLSYMLPVIAGLGLSLGGSAFALTHHDQVTLQRVHIPFLLVLVLLYRRAVITATGMVARALQRVMNMVYLILLMLLSNLQKQMIRW